jgi:hypothetical protein
VELYLLFAYIPAWSRRVLDTVLDKVNSMYMQKFGGNNTKNEITDKSKIKKKNNIEVGY